MNQKTQENDSFISRISLLLFWTLMNVPGKQMADIKILDE